MSNQVSKIFNGAITIVSPKSPDHRTFRIKTIKEGTLKGKRILSLLTGPDNTSSYTGFAFVSETGVHLWSKYRGNPLFERYAYLVWELSTNKQSPLLAEGYKILTQGTCICCNRMLTTPESIAQGIGPFCKERKGL